MITQAPLGGSRGAQCQLCCFLVVVQGDCLCWMLELGSLSWSCLLSLLSPLMSPQFLWPAVTALVSVSWRIHNNHKTSTSRHRESFKRYTSNYTMSQNPDLFTQLPGTGMKKNDLNSSICWFVKNLLCVKEMMEINISVLSLFFEIQLLLFIETIKTIKTVMPGWWHLTSSRKPHSTQQVCFEEFGKRRGNL